MQSRTSKVLKNTKIALLFFVVLMTMNFIARSVFIKHLGAEVLGVNTMLGNLIGFLNLAELGMTSAIASALYAPIANNNKKDISAIITIQDWFYRKVGLIVLLGGIILMLFLPWIFQKAQLPLWKIYTVFAVLWLSSLATYFLTFKQVLLVAEMKEYKISLYVKSLFILKLIIQITLLTVFDFEFKAWLLIEAIHLVLATLAVHYLINKEYPWLKIERHNSKLFLKDYPNVMKNTKQLFFHKFASFSLSQTTPFIIYYYSTVRTVTIYDNYMMIILGFVSLFVNVFSSMQGAIGNLVASSKKEDVVGFFEQYVVFRFWIALVISLTFYYQVTGFINLWVGTGFVVDQISVTLFSIYLFISLSRVFENFLMAYQIFHDIYAPVAEGIINISLAFILGYFFGLAGIIGGVVISLLVIVYGWKSYFLYKKVFGLNWINYWKSASNYYTISALVIVLIYIINKYQDINLLFISNFKGWFISSIIMASIISLLSFSIFMTFNKQFRSFITRVLEISKRRRV